MKAGWKRVKLGEVGRIVGGATPSTREASNYGGDISWISPKDLSGYADRYIEHGERNITQVGFDSCSTEMLPKGSVLFSSRAPIGYVAIAANELCTNQGFKSLIPDSSIIDGLFAYYLLVFNKDRIEALGSGTTFKEVSASVMRQVDVVLPPLPTQRRIAAVLGALDDAIELNRKMNANLEAQAQALFKSWFVDFAPFGGKMPKEWKMGTLGELVSVCYGKDHKKLADGSIPVFGSGGLMRYAEKSLFDQESVLIPRKGSLNNIMYADKPFWTVDTMFYTKMKVKNAAKYVYLFLHGKDMSSLNTGSAVPSMTTDILNAMKIIIPSENGLSEFDLKLSPMFRMIAANAAESRKLAETRDALLPKLMSGEVEVV